MPKASQNRIQKFIRLCEKQDYFRDQKLTIGESIHAGTRNRCWVIRSGEDKYLARLGRELADNLLTNWQKEIEINQFAAQVGLSTAAIFVDPSNLSAIYPWCGEPLDREDLTEAIISELGEKLGLLHITDAPAGAIGYCQTIESYLSLIGANSADDSRMSDVGELLELADQWDQSREQCFCHHDLHPGNILWNGETCTLIDWEYARLAHPLFDLASLCYYFHLSDAQLVVLLQNYPSSRYSAQQIRTAERMVVGLERLWCEATKLAFKNC